MPHLPPSQPLIIETCPFLKVLEETSIAEKKISPNLDYLAGPAYYVMGFEMFTLIFVLGRTHHGTT